MRPLAAGCEEAGEESGAGRLQEFQSAAAVGRADVEEQVAEFREDFSADGDCCELATQPSRPVQGVMDRERGVIDVEW